jgi:WASH complex subunit 7
MDLGKITILDYEIDIKDEIRQTLNENFYNINVINMHDMETYE